METQKKKGADSAPQRPLNQRAYSSSLTARHEGYERDKAALQDLGLSDAAYVSAIRVAAQRNGV